MAENETEIQPLVRLPVLDLTGGALDPMPLTTFETASMATRTACPCPRRAA